MNQAREGMNLESTGGGICLLCPVDAQNKSHPWRYTGLFLLHSWYTGLKLRISYGTTRHPKQTL